MHPSTNNEDHDAPSSGSTIRNEDVDMLNNQEQSQHTDGTATATSSQTMADAVSTGTFAARPRELIKTIQKISSLGIDATLPSLPKIVVVGDQSHGKSSVIEAMCGISLPREAGTCTRCPFEIVSTATDGEWSCVVTLIHRYDFKSSAKTWVKAAAPTTTEFASIRQPEQLEHVLRLAQTAILHPNLRPSDVRMNNDVNVGPGLGFSPDIVHLKISAPDLPELSLTDLPGAINVTENEDDTHLVRFVRNLITKYVNDPEAIILLTAAANADIELCYAFNIIRQQKASDRTLGVVTKPDLADAAITQRLGCIFSGQTWAVGHGWYATKQLSQIELNSGTVTRQYTRGLEQALFARPPWSDLNYPQRFGIQNLQDALSKKLTKHILKALPVISERVENRLKEVEDELSQFPEQTQAPCLEVIHDVHQVASAIDAKIKGSDLSNNSFCEAYSDVMKGLRRRFNTDAPELAMGTPGYKQPSISVLSDDEMDEDDGPSTTRSTPANTPSQNKSRKGNSGATLVTPTPNRYSDALPHRTPAKGTPMNKEGGFITGPGHTKAIFTIEDVRRRYELGSTSGLPDNLSPQVVEHIMRECLQGVRPRVNDTLKQVFSLISDTLQEGIVTTLATRAGTALVREATKTAYTFFKTLFAEEEALINNMIAAELHKPIVTDFAVHKDKKAAKLTFLKSARALRRVNEFFDTRDAATGKLTSRDERKKRAEDKNFLENTLRTDDHADMVEAMAGPFAYYDTATKRVMDVVKLRMEYGVFRALQERVREVLMRDLRVVDAEYCAELLAEDEGRERRRAELQGEKGRLERAVVELEGCRDV